MINEIQSYTQDFTTYRVKHHNTVQDYLAVVEAPCELSDSRRSSLGVKDSWAGCSYEQALRLAHAGWAEGLNTVSSIASRISAPILSKKELDLRFDVAPGDWIDNDRYLQGEPEVFCEITEAETLTHGNGKYVHIFYNVICSSAVNQTEINNRGAAVVALADIMETFGFRVKITLGVITGSHKTPGAVYGTTVTLKDYADQLDQDAIAFFFMHAASSRRIGFSYLEHGSAQFIEEHDTQSGKGYGRVVNCIPPHITGDTESLINFGGIYKTRKNERTVFSTEADTRAYVERILSQHGITLEK